jgi:peptide/nickel transport system permease protein
MKHLKAEKMININRLKVNRDNFLIIFQKFGLGGKLAFIVIALICSLALLSPLIQYYSPSLPSGNTLEAPSAKHWLGTDDLGVDILAQMLEGAKVSIAVGLVTAFLAVSIGTVIGVAAGYYGGKIDTILRLINDIFISFPQLPMMIVIGAFFKPSLLNIILVLTIFSWAGPARIIRSKVISVRKEPYICIAKAYGGSFLYNLRNHIMAQIFPLVLISFSKMVGRVIIAESSLAFLGLGDPAARSWGLIINMAIGFQGIFHSNYWLWWLVPPIAAIIIVVTAFAVISRELEKIYIIKI